VALHKSGVDVRIWGPALFGKASTGIREVTPSIPVDYSWYNEQDNAGAVAHNIVTFQQLVERDRPDVVHFQHEFGLWGQNDGFIQQLRAVREAGARVVITLHTVFPYGGYDHRTGFFDRLRHVTDAIIVHTPHAYTALEMARGPVPVYLVPHGTPEEPPGDPARGYDYLELKRRDDSVLCLVFGFVGHGKNIEGTVFAFAEGLARRWIPPNVTLCIVGDASDERYPMYLEQAIDATGYGPCIKFMRKLVPVGTVPHIMAAADFAVLNTNAHTLSASGAVHAHIAHGVPLAVAARPIYHDALSAGALPFDLNDEHPNRPTLSAITALSVLARCPTARAIVSDGMKKLAAETRWSTLVERYKNLYGGVL
jgi:glycosyltransferase involved in cell wall biosynthesis